MILVFTLRSLDACLASAPNDSWFGTIAVPADGSWEVLSTTVGPSKYVVHRSDSESDAKIILFSQNSVPLGPAPSAAWRAIFQRIHRTALSAQSSPLRLPPEWSEFHENNLVAFFANPRRYGAFRWIAELHPDGTNSVCFWKLTKSDDQIQLQYFERDYTLLRQAISNWSAAYSSIRSHFENIPQREDTTALQAAIDLDATTFGAVTQHRTYSTWLDHLTQKQIEFIEAPLSHSVKLRGPAGSGKTLTLELKVLRELYRAREQNQNIRILFATHSWAIAEQVDAGLRSLDESGDVSSIIVYPLLAIVRFGLPRERSAGGFALLGEDSLSGKRLQLEYIDTILEHLVRGDWLTYQAQSSDAFRRRVESDQNSPERNALVWDLMNEFACVLSAHGILPGINAERQYLGLQRSPWMMPLHTDAEKRFVLSVYTQYVSALKHDSLLTSDQLVNDYLNFLTTFTWNVRREEEGYDLIFVDEFHLFNEQERFVLHYLTRSPNVYPKMFMALDPRQSPSEVYADFPVSAIATGYSGAADVDLGEIGSVELSTIHRFTPEILELVRHIHRTYPALDLGSDWEIDMESVQSSAGHGDLPIMVRHALAQEEVVGAVDRVRTMARECDQHERAALILLDASLLGRYEAAVEELKENFCILSSRTDVDTLRYRRKSIVLSASEYVGGLQFDYVVIAGFPSLPRSVANLGHQQRRFLSLLYLAVSRSTRRVEIHVNDEAGGVPKLLEDAVERGVVQLQG